MPSPTTLTRYKRRWDHWVAYANSLNQSPLPAPLNTLGRYLASLPAWPVVEQTVCAINHYHVEAGYPKPCRHPKIKALMKEFRIKAPYDFTSNKGSTSIGRYPNKSANSAQERSRRTLLREIHEAIASNSPLPYRARYTPLWSPKERHKYLQAEDVVRSRLPPSKRS